MAWVRIHDGALTHPKIYPIFTWKSAFSVWIWGLSHSQQHLTNGFIAGESVPKRGLRSAKLLVDRGLWEVVAGGWQIHDYLQWNDSKATIEARRQQAYGRLQAFKQKQRTDEAVAEAKKRVSTTRFERVSSTPTKPNQTIVQRNTEHSSGEVAKTGDPRVREFLEWFQAKYREERAGADYCVIWAKHGAIVKRLLGATTLPRLKHCAQILLSERCDEDFIVQTDRGIEILATKFNWLSDRLAQWEARHARANPA